MVKKISTVHMHMLSITTYGIKKVRAIVPRTYKLNTVEKN